MQSFIIKQLRVSGKDRTDGVVDFSDGLNIIQGRSDTGKTWILNCIHYLFGSNDNPYTPITGYTDIEGVFITKRFGEIKILRRLDSTTAYITAESGLVQDGKYATSYKQKADLYLNDLWLRILGADETVRVPKNARYERERISWTNLSNIFWIDEDEIVNTGSIVLESYTADTSLIASLYYLLTGDYKEGVTEIPRPDVISASKDTVVELVDGQQQRLLARKADYEKQLDDLGAADTVREMDGLSGRIQGIQHEIEELMDEDMSIAIQIDEHRQKDASYRILLERYESLISQYKADLQRMDFITKGERAVRQVPTNNVCPFCGGAVIHEDESYAEAIRAETKRIVNELAIIVATEREVSAELEDNQKTMSDLKERRRSIEWELDEKRNELQNSKADLTKFINITNITNAINLINEQIDSLDEVKELKLQKFDNLPRYHGKDEIGRYVGRSFDDILNRILEECHCGAGYATWDFTSFDIRMNGIPKCENQGKGYRAFLNSVIGLMLYEYFNKEDAYIKPGILIIDTPLLGFDENQNAFDGQTVRMGLYHYFLNHQGNGQMIIVDNLKEMPEIDFDNYGINIITYHKDDADGHVYGFMPGWRKELGQDNE